MDLPTRYLLLEKLLKVVELKEAAERRNLGLVPPADAPDSAEEKSLCIQN